MKKVRKFLKSLRFAGYGLRLAFREQNFKILTLASALTIGLSLSLPLKPWELITVLLLVTFVLVLEIVNSVFERVADLVEPKIHHYVMELKDLMAAAVLLVSLAAFVIGGIIFYPYIQRFISSI